MADEVVTAKAANLLYRDVVGQSPAIPLGHEPPVGADRGATMWNATGTTRIAPFNTGDAPVDADQPEVFGEAVYNADGDTGADYKQ